MTHALMKTSFAEFADLLAETTIQASCNLGAALLHIGFHNTYGEVLLVSTLADSAWMIL